MPDQLSNELSNKQHTQPQAAPPLAVCVLADLFVQESGGIDRATAETIAAKFVNGHELPYVQRVCALVRLEKKRKPTTKPIRFAEYLLSHGADFSELEREEKLEREKEKQAKREADAREDLERAQLAAREYAIQRSRVEAQQTILRNERRAAFNDVLLSLASLGPPQVTVT